MATGGTGAQLRKSSVRNMMLCGLATSLLLSAGCAWRHGAAEGSTGDVGDAKQACATTFCSPEEQAHTAGQCAPSCMCGRYEFSEPTYDEHDIHALRSWTLVNPTELLPADPYGDPSFEHQESTAYCAAIPVDPSPRERSYRLQTFPTERAAVEAGGQVTHRGSCGACSSFQDLAVYIERSNLSRAGRLCGLRGTFGSQKQLSCLENLGFTDACAQIWNFNVDHTRSECLGTCTASLPTKRKVPAGSLNACLACDEEKSGPIFKAVAGRTRRRSGLSSAIARPCLDEQGEPAVYPVEHFYFRQASSLARN